MNKKIILTGIILSLTFAINAQSWWGKSEKIKGNGKVVTVIKSTKEYSGISIGGSFDVLLVKGEEGKITIEGEENIIPYIESVVEENILKINYKKNINIRTTKKLTITVAFNNLESVALGGSGNISSKEFIKSSDFKVSLGGSGNITLNIDAATTKVSMSGSGNIRLKGNSSKFNCALAGSGSISAYELNTDELKATIAGSGNIKTTVSTKIKAKVVGSGSVFYKGKPTKIDSKTVGSGTIIDKN